MTADWVAPPIQANGPGLELPPDSSSLRDRIARAIAGADSGTLHGVKPCAACQTGDTNQPCDDCLTMADAVIAALGLREERAAGRAETTTDDATQRLARAAYAVDSKHHFHEGQDGRPACSCGFVGDARKRTQTEHITAAVLEEYDHD